MVRFGLLKKKSNKTKHLINQGLGHLRGGIYKPGSTPLHLLPFKTIRVVNRAGVQISLQDTCLALALPLGKSAALSCHFSSLQWVSEYQPHRGCFEDLWHVLLSLLSFCFSLRQGLAVSSSLAGLELHMQSRLTLNLKINLLYFLNAGIKGVPYHLLPLERWLIGL